MHLIFVGRKPLVWSLMVILTSERVVSHHRVFSPDVPKAFADISWPASEDTVAQLSWRRFRLSKVNVQWSPSIHFFHKFVFCISLILSVRSRRQPLCNTRGPTPALNQCFLTSIHVLDLIVNLSAVKQLPRTTMSCFPHPFLTNSYSQR